MSLEDQDYLEQRAETEIRLAQQARHQRAVQAHYELASAYLDIIHGETPKSSGGLFEG
jgi:hypothetical protein